jgi:hypothetical protein
MTVHRSRDEHWLDHRPRTTAVAIAILLAFTLGLCKVFGLSLIDVLSWLLWLIEGGLR